MSKQRHCSLYKAVDGQFYMELGDQEYATNEDSPCYGPFPSEAALMRELDRHSNPGGWDEDFSGTAPVPTESPNGGPVIAPGRSLYSSPRTSWPRMR